MDDSLSLFNYSIGRCKDLGIFSAKAATGSPWDRNQIGIK